MSTADDRYLGPGDDSSYAGRLPGEYPVVERPRSHLAPPLFYVSVLDTGDPMGGRRVSWSGRGMQVTPSVERVQGGLRPSRGLPLW